jgi:hypothetical protein
VGLYFFRWIYCSFWGPKYGGIVDAGLALTDKKNLVLTIRLFSSAVYIQGISYVILNFVIINFVTYIFCL